MLYFDRYTINFISHDPKHDNCLYIASLKQWVQEIQNESPDITHIFVCSDCSSKEFKSTPCLARIQKIADETGLVFLVNQWARLMGKWLYDSSGKRWEVRYYKHAVGSLGVKADDLHAVAEYMNDTFGTPVIGDKAPQLQENHCRPFN